MSTTTATERAYGPMSWSINPNAPATNEAWAKRMRLTEEQVAVLEAAIQTRIDAGHRQSEIALELASWCGQTPKALQTRVRNMQREVAA